MDNLLNAILIKRLNEQDKKISDSFKDIKEVVETIVNKHYDSLDVDFSIEKILGEINERYNTTIDSLSQEIAEEFKEAIQELKDNNQDTLDKSINDYITKSEKKISKLKPKDGKDYVITEKDYKKIAKLVEVKVPEYEIPKQPTPDEIRDMLELLQGDDRLDISAIKGFDEILEQIKKADKNIIVGGYRGVQEAPTDSKTYGRNNGEWVEITATGGGTWGSITGTLSDQTDLQTALDSKQNTSEKNEPSGYAGIKELGDARKRIWSNDATPDDQLDGIHIRSSNPTTAEDTKAGYATHDKWINTAVTPRTMFYCDDSDSGTWSQIGGATAEISADQVSTSGSLGGSNVQEDLDILGENKIDKVISTDEAIARFDGTTGQLKDSLIKITDNGSLILPENSDPTPPEAGEIKLFAREIAGRLFPSFVGPSGLDSALQPLLARNKVGYWNPPGGATTVPGVFGFTAPTVTGFSAALRSIQTTNMLTRMRRLGFQTVATAGTVGHWRHSVNYVTTGTGDGLGGFTYIKRFAISDPAYVANARMFIGLRSSATPTNVEPSTLTNCIGIGHGASDTTMQLYFGGTVAQTPIDLGADFPSNTGNVDIYEIALFASPIEIGTINWKVTRVNTGHTASGTVSGDNTVIPQSNTGMAVWGYRTNNTTALAVAIDVCSVYIETDQ